MAKSVLVDLTRCIGCRGCQVACKAWNERRTRPTTIRGTFTNPERLSSDTYTFIRFVEEEVQGGPVWTFIKDQCLHCKDPACVSVCPVAALVKTPTGPVTYSHDRCIGCRYCMIACPFQIPKYEWESPLPWVQKCDFCAERLAEGMLPACVKTCPTGTMFFGEAEEVAAEAERRLAKGGYVDHIYGKEEAGGTSWIYLASRPFAELGFRTQVSKRPLPPLTWEYITHIPAIFGLVFAVGLGAWVVTRRDEVAEKEGRR
ncbi:MAG: 4Fe-4S dicluster domain-containing protein [Thermodesulfobacteriota bacterium]